MEVIYLGIRRSPEEIAAAATQEDVDVIGLSILSGSHIEMTTRLRRALDQAGMSATPVLVGGIIPEEDHAELRALGVREILGPGTPLDLLVRSFENATKEHA
jgi:methylmalonyl-CoA mutase C-terminal domain/subunit